MRLGFFDKTRKLLHSMNIFIYKRAKLNQRPTYYFLTVSLLNLFSSKMLRKMYVKTIKTNKIHYDAEIYQSNNIWFPTTK